jgi:hypothetical protein
MDGPAISSRGRSQLHQQCLFGPHSYRSIPLCTTILALKTSVADALADLAHAVSVAPVGAFVQGVALLARRLLTVQPRVVCVAKTGAFGAAHATLWQEILMATRFRNLLDKIPVAR